MSCYRCGNESKEITHTWGTTKFVALCPNHPMCV